MPGNLRLLTLYEGQNHAVHDFVGAPQAPMDGRKTERTPARKPKRMLRLEWHPRNAPIPVQGD
jgi:hypothetical protein